MKIMLWMQKSLQKNGTNKITKKVIRSVLETNISNTVYEDRSDSLKPLSKDSVQSDIDISEYWWAISGKIENIFSSKQADEPIVVDNDLSS